MASDNNNNNNSEPHIKNIIKTEKIIILILLIIILLVLLFVEYKDLPESIFTKVSKDPTTSASQEASNQSDMFSISINSEIYLNEDGTCAAYIKNPKCNTCNLNVNLKDKDGFLLYQSDVLTPGQHIDIIEIDKTKMQKGENKITAEFFAIDSKSGTVESQINVDVSIFY